MDIAIFGSSLVSAYWNGAATYYRGLVRALAARGHRIRFYEPDAFDRQAHRDMPDPQWARVIVYPPDAVSALQTLEHALDADLIIKTSGIGVNDRLLEDAVPASARAATLTAFLDVDAPATLERLQSDASDPFHAALPRYDLVLTYGGAHPVVNAYRAIGARACVPIFNALDPDTHYPVPCQTRFSADLAFLGNRLPDREMRVREFLLGPASVLRNHRFLLGGSGWEPWQLPPNVRPLGHVFTADHNAFYSSPRAVLNISRESMARFGFSPATRVFEAAGAGACLISDRWPGIERFLEPGREVLVASSGEEVCDRLRSLEPEAAAAIGAAARRRILAEHTYAHRALDFERVLEGRCQRSAAL